MAIPRNKRYSIILSHMYPALKVLVDWKVTDGVLTWLNEDDDVTAPTNTTMDNAREAATDAWWWRRLRQRRDKLLHQSDWSTYRGELRDIPTTVTKPAFSVLDDKEVNTMLNDIIALMPTKPS
mgnify:CR=1 FL=1